MRKIQSRRREIGPMEDSLQTVKALLEKIYQDDRAKEAFELIRPELEKYLKKPEETPEQYFSEKDALLVTYGDSLQKQGQKPLETLQQFANDHLQELFSGIHILPFFPWSSDDGFSVKDYLAVDPALGEWNDIEALSQNFRIMFDLVLNHISAESDWFARYLAEEPEFADLAIEVDPATDLSSVTRPRSLPLLTPFKKKNGKEVHLWTTFSEDQIDLNYASPNVMARMLKVLLEYADRGAGLVRLDAVAYLWKKIGTSCIHLPETHEVVKLLRRVFNIANPEGILITETNVPHRENIRYFGDGHSEAQMVYNFTLPPLLLYCLLKGDSRELSNWAATLEAASKDNTFFNFTASHDGIGVRPLEGILPKEALNGIIKHVESNGGRVSTKRNPDGSDSPYELNISYVDALYRPDEAGEDPWHPNRFLASQAIQMVLPGVPGVYIHSLLGSHNWEEGVRQTGRARSINREKLDVEQVENELTREGSFRQMIFTGLRKLLTMRRKQPAFHPNAGFSILQPDSRVFAIRREAEEQQVVAVTNLTEASLQLNPASLGLSAESTDQLRGEKFGPHKIDLAPYETVWLVEG
jgi:glucosylglycerate phosphorylase